MVRLSDDCSSIDWFAAVEVFRRAPLGSREPDKLKRAFENSFTAVFAFDGESLVGLGRAICDGEYQAAIYDVVVLPEYQGRSVGKMIMDKIMSSLPVKNIILYAVPGKEGFYKKSGFHLMKTAMAQLNPGMSNPQAGYLAIDEPSNKPDAADG